MDLVNIWIVIGAALLTGLTPGPATLAIAGTSMARGRSMGLALAWGVSSGSVLWAVFAALGFGAVLTANQWAMEALRYAGAAYLALLGYKAARSAMTAREMKTRAVGANSHLVAWTKGALIHLTNPKAVLYWGSIFAVGLQPGAEMASVGWIVGVSLLISFATMTSYALLFSSAPLTRAYLRARRGIEAAFAAFFGGAAVYLLSTNAE